MRGDTLQAYDELTNNILPYALEHGTKLMRLRAVSLLAKIVMKLANQATQADSSDSAEIEEAKN